MLFKTPFRVTTIAAIISTSTLALDNIDPERHIAPK